LAGIPYKVFLFTIIFSPLAFGAVEPWSLFIMEVSTFLAVCIGLFGQRNKETLFYEVPGLLPLMALLLFIGFQLLPLPPGLIRVLSPGSYALNSDSIWLGEPGKWVSLSINKKATLAELLRFASYAGIYVLTIQLHAHARVLRRTVAVIAAFGSALAFFAIIQHLLPNNRIYWMRELTQGGVLFGPYVNRNHYAGLMGMIFPVVMSLFLYYRPKGEHASFRERLAGVFTHPQANISMLLGFSAVLAAASIFLCLSRGGIASLIMSMIFLGLLLRKKSGMSRRGLLFASTIIVILYAVGWFGWGPIFERFQSIRNSQGGISELRLDLWKDSLNTIRDFPLTGTGFGSYIDIYPSYRTIAGEGIADHAHNDYIELLTNGGAISMMLLFWFFSVVAFRSYKTFQRRRDPYSLFLYSGILAGIFSILLHGITDFNLQIGANGLYLFFMLGMAVSASHTREHEEAQSTLLRTVTNFSGKFLFAAVSCSALFLCLVFYSGRLLGWFLHSEIRSTPLSSSMPKDDLLFVGDTLARASLFDPLNPEYHYKRALTEALSSNFPSALKEYEAAVGLSPANSFYLQSLGLFHWKRGEGNLAGAYLRSGVARDVRDTDARKRLGALLIEQGKRAEGLDMFRTAALLEPSKTRENITVMVLAGLSDEEIRAALPERAESYIIFANYLDKTGKDEMASDTYTLALSYAGSEKQRTAASFYAAYNYYVRKELFARAAETMEKAAEIFPRDPAVKLRLAEAYEKEDLKAKALEQYRAVLEIDPKNMRAQKKIQELN
jgi:O-antigen ligase/Tfp pilus assembly protein PilF